MVTLVEDAPERNDDARCGHTVSDDAGIPLVPDAERNRVHAAFPVRSSTGTVLATLCVSGSEPRELTATQLTLLTVVASQVAARLDLGRELRPQAEATAGHEESEQLYRLLAAHSSDIISKHDLTGRVLYVSPSVHTVLGHEPERELYTQPATLVRQISDTAPAAPG